MQGMVDSVSNGAAGVIPHVFIRASGYEGVDLHVEVIGNAVKQSLKDLESAFLTICDESYDGQDSKARDIVTLQFAAAISTTIGTAKVLQSSASEFVGFERGGRTYVLQRADVIPLQVSNRNTSECILTFQVRCPREYPAEDKEHMHRST